MKRTVFFCLLLCAGLAHSQQQKPDTTKLPPVEVRATRAGSKAPFTKTNLKKEAIQQQNLGADLPFLLNQTPSVVVNSDAGNGVGYTGIRIRGTDATRINVTLNGIPYNDAESQGTFFVDLPDFASSLQSVQIQRGVGTSSNGAGAFGATLNLSTNELNEQAYAEFNNSAGSFNTFKNTVKLGTGLIGKHFTTDLRLSNITSDGYMERASSDLKSYYISSAYTAKNTTLRLNVFSGTEKTYQAWNGVTADDLKNNRRMNYSGTEKEGTPYEDETDNYLQQHYQLFLNQRLNDRLVFHTGLFYIKGRGYYEQYKASRDYAEFGLQVPVAGQDTLYSSDFVRQLWLDNESYGNVFSLLYRNAKTELTFGGAITKYNGNHYGDVIWAKGGMPEPKHRYYNLDAWKNDANFYGKWQQEVAPFLFTYADLQFRKVHYRIDGFRDRPNVFVNNDYSFFNPKAGISYNRNNLQVYASYGLAQKEPNRDDFETGLHQQPKPERLHDFELGIEQRSARFSFGATAYYMRYKDQLVLTGQINDVGAYTRTNIDHSYRLGVEVQAAATLAPWLQLSGNLALSRNKVLRFTEYLDDYDENTQQVVRYKEPDIAFSPAVVGAAQVQIRPYKNINIFLNSKYVGRQYLDNTQNKDRMLDGYFVQDAQLRYTLPLKQVRNLELIAQAYNIFNKLYAPNGYTYSYVANKEVVTENYYFPMAGFNWMFGLNIRL